MIKEYKKTNLNYKLPVILGVDELNLTGHLRQFHMVS